MMRWLMLFTSPVNYNVLQDQNILILHILVCCSPLEPLGLFWYFVTIWFHKKCSFLCFVLSKLFKYRKEMSNHFNPPHFNSLKKLLQPNSYHLCFPHLFINLVDSCFQSSQSIAISFEILDLKLNLVHWEGFEYGTTEKKE